MARLKAPEPVVSPTGDGVMPEHLRGDIMARMAAFYDPSESVPDWWSPREPLGYYGSRAKQEGRWREASAFRRAQDARRAWLAERGYVRPSGHVDWQRVNRDYGDPPQATSGNKSGA